MYRAIDKWLPGYLRSVLSRPRLGAGPRHLCFCVTDHFEPLGLVAREDGAAPRFTREERLAVVEQWARQYPEAAGAWQDADGQRPRHTFFYPPDEYDAECLSKVAALCARRFAEIEIHLHHRHDTPDALRDRLAEFCTLLRREHGLLGSWRQDRPQTTDYGLRTTDHGPQTTDHGLRTTDQGRGTAGIAYGFIHGNWALCNARPDGDWCGVNEELAVLRGTGCYADFTFPSAPSSTQPKMVNALYRAWDRPGGRGADGGQRVRVQGSGVRGPLSGSLMLIQGPLALDWSRRKWGILPRLDNGAITHFNRTTPERIDRWVRQHVHVQGRPEWVFVKVHAHGAIPSTSRVFLGEPMREAHAHLQKVYNDGKVWRLHYASAREMYNIVRAAEDGREGDPGEYRDYEVQPPPAAGGS